MNLISKIPKDFYKLFASKYMNYYQRFLTAVYEESGRSYSLLGLTERECRLIMNDQALRAVSLRLSAIYTLQHRRRPKKDGLLRFFLSFRSSKIRL